MDLSSWHAAVTAQNSAPDCRAAAHAYVDLGFTPVPWSAGPGGKKHPHLVYGLHYGREPAYRTSHDAIASWEPGWQCGIVVSALTGWWALDIDLLASWHELEPLLGIVTSPVLTQSTGRDVGGFHLIYHGSGSQPWPAQRMILPKIELRSNGFIAVPPSLHPSGRRYQWTG